MCGTDVLRWSSVSIPVRLSKSTPASSSPTPSTTGPRPTETNIKSQSTDSPSPKCTVSALPFCSTFVHCLPSCSVIPRLPNAFASSFAASASSCGISASSISTIVTSEPKRLKIDANSEPMMPPPRMTRRFGTSVCASRPVESTQRSLSSPSIGGGAGGVDERVAFEPFDRRAQRERAGRDDRRLERDVLPALDRDRVRVLELAGALHPLDAVRLQQARDAPRHLLDDTGLPLVGRREVERRAVDLDAELRERLVPLVEEVRGLHPRLRRDAPDAQA